MSPSYVIETMLNSGGPNNSKMGDTIPSFKATDSSYTPERQTLVLKLNKTPVLYSGRSGVPRSPERQLFIKYAFPLT